MSALRVLVNCIILSIALRGTFSTAETDCWNPLQTRQVMVHGICNLSMYRREDYKYTPGMGSYKLHTKAETWNDARKICNEEGGHLAVINSKAEQSVLMKLFDRSGPITGSKHEDAAFLGTHDHYKEGDWTTVLGQPLTETGFTEWSDQWGGQPDNRGGKQHCGALLKDGKMDDVYCYLAYAFFCEIPETITL